ncbi:hypothetical protein WJX74_005416 [Apatococcus lobatus]|uniref:DUF2834 domain-containing protein n=2 Tax=Apatococcus TaxID=904362 RepID=A0AAW1SUT1_9CHLO
MTSSGVLRSAELLFPARNCQARPVHTCLQSPCRQQLAYTSPLRPSTQSTLRRAWLSSGIQRPRPSPSHGILCNAKGSESPAATSPESQSTLFSVGLGLLWAAFTSYAFIFSPNQTPLRDLYFIECLSFLQGLDGPSKVNAIFTGLFFTLGIFPAIYSALLIPSARSGNKIPAWPFVSLSFAFGVFPLIPFWALRTPAKDLVVPPPRNELGNGLRVLESKITAVSLAIGSAICLGYIISHLPPFADSKLLVDYLRLFDESRVVHVSSLDALALVAFSPYWMYNDAERRQWSSRGQILPFLSFLPVLGPAIYLVLRPHTKQ